MVLDVVVVSVETNVVCTTVVDGVVVSSIVLDIKNVSAKLSIVVQCCSFNCGIWRCCFVSCTIWKLFLRYFMMWILQL